MHGDDSSRRPFRVITGGLSTALRIGGVPVFLTSPNRAPCPVDGLVSEEDRFLIMERSNAVRPPDEHPLRIIDRAWKQEPLPVGSIQVCTGKPHRFLAVVHDLDRSPTCRPIWVLAALAALKQELLTLDNIKALAMPLLGVRHGPLSAEESLRLLIQAMASERWPLQKIWLQVHNKNQPRVRDLLTHGL